MYALKFCASVCVPFFLFSRVLTVNGLRSILINGAPNTIFPFEHCANVILTPFVESDCRTVLCIGRQAYSIRCACISFSRLVNLPFSLTLLDGLVYFIFANDISFRLSCCYVCTVCFSQLFTC